MKSDLPNEFPANLPISESLLFLKFAMNSHVSWDNKIIFVNLMQFLAQLGAL